MTIQFVKKMIVLVNSRPRSMLDAGVHAMAILVLPDEIQRVVEAEVFEGRYADAAEYVTQLVRQDQNDRAAMDLEALVLEGMQSGDPVEMTAEKWEKMRLAFHRLADSGA